MLHLTVELQSPNKQPFFQFKASNNIICGEKKEKMDLDRKRVAASSSRNGVVGGSVWESRMKGSFKVFNGDNNNINSSQETEKPNEKNHPINTNNELRQLEKKLKSKQSSNGVAGGGKRKTWKSDDNFERIEKTPVQISKIRSENKKIPTQRMIKTGSLSRKGSVGGESFGGIERNDSIPLRKVKSETIKVNGISDCIKEIEGSNEEIEEKKTRSSSNQSLEEFGVGCEEKLITDDIGKVKPPQTLTIEEDDDEEQELEASTMAEKEEENNEEKGIVVVKEMNLLSSNQKPISSISPKKPTDLVIENKKNYHKNERLIPISKTVRKHPVHVVNLPRILSKPALVADALPSQKATKHHSKLQSFIDLIMWRDISKSALIFGFGTFSILSSTYTKDLNISFISVTSYLGLIYLAVIFIFRSIVSRGAVEGDIITDDEHYIVGEEEAIWVLKLILPYTNEFLLKVKALFSGDPATTMKLAVLLFILAKCGSSITIWKMAKLGFFGVFTIPKISSSYSSQLTAYGTFWFRRFKDAWETCTHKKAVAFGIFTIVWNLSSTVSRIWAVFMLFVAFKYYQQSMVRDEEIVEEEAIIGRSQSQRSWQEQRTEKIPNSKEITKSMKRS